MQGNSEGDPSNSWQPQLNWGKNVMMIRGNNGGIRDGKSTVVRLSVRYPGGLEGASRLQQLFFLL